MRSPADPPAHDIAGIDVDDEGDIDEPRPGRDIGSGLTDQSQKMTFAARVIAEKKALGTGRSVWRPSRVLGAISTQTDSAGIPIPPSHDVIVASSARTVALGKIAPRCTRSQHPKDAVQHTPIIDARYASRLVGQQGLNHAPLEVGQVVPAYGELESETDEEVQPAFRLRFHRTKSRRDRSSRHVRR